MIHLKAKEVHDTFVQRLQKKILEEKGKISLKSTTPSNTLRNGEYKKGTHKLDLSPLNSILIINKEEGWALVEPRITYKKLCALTLKEGLIPAVVPEFNSITLGGAIMGAALESSSHRYGQVNDTCLGFELILGNGEKVWASREEHSDLFYAIPGSYGTLAVLTLIKLKLVKAQKWVRLTYQKFSNLETLASFLKAPHSADFVEAIVLDPKTSVAILGEMVPHPAEPIYRQKWHWSPWYVQHLSQTPHSEEYMTLEEYLFRLDRGAFWMGRFLTIPAMLQLLFRLGIPKISPHSINAPFLFRFLFGKLTTSAYLYKMWHRVSNTVAENLFFVHDFYAPAKKLPEILKDFLAKTGIYPVWLCPIKGGGREQFLSPHFGEENFINIGLYGIPNNHQNIPSLTSQIENAILKYQGRKMLYSFTYYDRETFSKAYDESRYQTLRKKYFAESTFPPLYNKIVAHKAPI